MSYAPVKLAAEMLRKKFGVVSASSGVEGRDDISAIKTPAMKDDEAVGVIRRRRSQVVVEKVAKCRKSKYDGEILTSKKKLKIANVTEGMVELKRVPISNIKMKDSNLQTNSLRRSARLLIRLEHL